MTDQTSAVQPVKGMVWLHARRKTWNGEPTRMTVTSVNVKTGIVYSNNPQYTKIKTPLALFALDKLVKEVVSTPEVKVAVPVVKLSDDQCAALFAKADAAGLAAGKAARPTPMVVVQRANPFDDTSPITRRYAPVMDGVCGFAWIKIRPATGSFVRWLKARDKGYKSYTGGYDISVNAFEQSLERKAAYARAFAAVLTEAGMTAYPQSRMD